MLKDWITFEKHKNNPKKNRKLDLKILKKKKMIVERGVQLKKYKYTHSQKNTNHWYNSKMFNSFKV